MRNLQRLRVGLTAFALTAGALSDCMAAETQATQAEEGSLQEVIVTARKRLESAQDVPIALTVLSGEDIQREGFISSWDIAAAVPNMVWDASSTVNVPNIFIRGVGDASFQTNQVGGVGMYMDEISLNSPLSWNFGLFDLARVEVLKGPQNTLFGRNTTGGAVQVESRTPTINEGFGGSASVTGGNYGRFDAEAALELPLGEQFAARLSGARFSQGNYIDNLNLHREEGAWEREVGRLQLLWQPSADFKALANFHIGEFSGGATRYKEIGLSNPAAPGNSNCPYLATNTNPGNGCSDQTGFIDNGNFNQVFANSIDINNANTNGALLRFDWTQPVFTLTALTGYEHEDSRRAEDSVGGPSFIFNYEQQTDSNQLSQELRAASAGSDPLAWIGGLYYFNESLHTTQDARRANPILTNVETPGVPIPEAGVQSFIPFTMLDQRDTSWSAYGQLDFKATSRLTLSGGLRFTTEKKNGTLNPGAVADTAPLFPAAEFIGTDQINQLLAGATLAPYGPLPFVCPAPFPLGHCYESIPYDFTSNILGGKVSLNYRLADDVNSYLSAARGFKAGEISTATLDSIVGRGGTIISPETLWTYEAGVKSEWLDHRLRANVAIFYNSWLNEQLFLVENTPLGANAVLTNVPKTMSDGADIDITAAPGAGWSTTVGVGLLHSKVVDKGTIPGATDGAELIGAPKVTMNTRIRKEWNLASGVAGVQTEARYLGAQHFDLSNTPVAIEPGYWEYNAAADYKFGPSGRYQASLWGKNLTGTQSCFWRGSQEGIGFGDDYQCGPNPPRRFFGLTLRASFE